VEGIGAPGDVDRDGAYLAALTDWLACACAGACERAASAMRACGDDLLADVAFAATAGHVLDFDDTFSAGVAHVSAATAPAALVLAAHLGLPLRAALDAYADGFEAMAAVAEASHPGLYDAGWHPTTVCGPVGAAVAASRLLDLPAAQHQSALAAALLRAGGTRGAFGSDGKAIQVGLAAAAGVQAALLARAGAIVDRRVIHGPLGFEAVLGARWAQPRAPLAQRERDGDSVRTVDGDSVRAIDGDSVRAIDGDSVRAIDGDSVRAIDGNWIKLHPSCLGTHSPIEAAVQARDGGYRFGHDELEIAVHPLARQAAHLDLVADGMSAKFSIPYCVAHTLIHGAPGVRDFVGIDSVTRDRSRLVSVSVDGSLPAFGAVLRAQGRELARVPCPRGAPDRPLAAADLAAKVADLSGDRLQGALEDLAAPAASALLAAGLSGKRPAAAR
jgi:2-methylcitrate dehydratase PrpD